MTKYLSNYFCGIIASEAYAVFITKQFFCRISSEVYATKKRICDKHTE